MTSCPPSVRARTRRATLVFSLAVLAISILGFARPVAAQPDVIVGSLQQVTSYGNVGDTYAYAVGTTSCNVGNQVLQWQSGTNLHPVIGQEMYKLTPDGQFTQIGISWLKHGFCALSQTLCGPCQSTSCPTLGIGCSDPYTATRNGSQSTLGPRWQVDAHTGVFPYPFANPSTAPTIGRRLQVNAADLDPALNPGALYFVEGHYVTQDDAQAGNGDNNTSYRQISVNPSSYAIGLISGEGTVQELPGLYAWQEHFPDVVIEEARVPGEGLMMLGYRVSDNGDGTWHYEYCLYNMNSDTSANSFSVPLPTGVSLSNVEFYGVPYHSGEPYNSAPWDSVQTATSITWSTESFATNANANALRWSRLYTFRFDANAGPIGVDATVGLFKTAGSMTVSTMAPDGDFIVAPQSLTCASTLDGIQLNWTNGEAYDAIEVRRDGALLASLGGGATSYLDPAVEIGASHTYTVTGLVGPDATADTACVGTMEPQIGITLVGAAPALISSVGQDVIFDIVGVNGGAYASGSARLFYDAGAGLEEVVATSLGGTEYSASIPSLPCGTTVSFYLTADSASGYGHAEPSDAPANTFDATVADANVTVVDDDLEADLGWTVGAPGDDASTGVWARVDPIGTDAQPADDHSNPGTVCWVTGQGSVGGSLGENDVDSGSTTLLTPIFDLSTSIDPTISYWRWYSNDEGASANADVFVIEISADGTNWFEVETVGPGGAEASGGWFENQFAVADFVPLSATVQMRFVASDLGDGSIVEAAIDDFRLDDVECAPAGASFVRGDCNQDGGTDLSDALAFLDYLFLGGGEPNCLDACDFNDDGSSSIVDVVYYLVFQFEGGQPPAAPFPDCGTDGTVFDGFTCDSFTACP
ncbi:MAG: hypothetical protein AAF488_00830 [Planctomycetota bacterium]